LTCDEPPAGGKVHIDAPLASSHWRVGKRITFSGGAEDGGGTPLRSSRLTWTVVMAHCPSTCHSHVIESFHGVRSGSFLAPDHEYPSHLELRLSAALPDGGTVTRRIDLDPRTVELTFKTTPQGLPLVVGATAGPAPVTRTVMVGSVNSLSAPATATLSGGGTANFSHWSDGGARNHTVVAPASPTSYRATYLTPDP